MRELKLQSVTRPYLQIITRISGGKAVANQFARAFAAIRAFMDASADIASAASAFDLRA